ncbi:MAG: DUF1566 domain-containing protein [Deltaproteobacteria bacterium]|nr:DUF1566 domain-containing protein [Deltaproteobacteria bacterium]
MNRRIVPLSLALVACGSTSSSPSDTPANPDLTGSEVGYDVPPGEAVADADDEMPPADGAGETDAEECFPVTSPNGYRDLCDGTILAPNGLMWAKETTNEPFEFGKTTCVNLVLGYDDWRLPDIDELRSLILGCEKTMPGGACGVTEKPECYKRSECWTMAECWPCAMNLGPGKDGAYVDDLFTPTQPLYWSSSLADTTTEKRGWGVTYYNAAVTVSPLSGYGEVRCVRGP